MGKYDVLLAEHNQLKLNFARMEEKATQLQKQLEAIVAAKEKLEKDLTKQTTNAALRERENEDLRKKLREIGNDSLGSSMEVERLQNALKKKEQELDDIITRVKGLTSGGSGIITDLSDAIRIMKEKITRAKHNVRIILPRLTDFDRYKFMEALEKLTPTVIVNIAAAMDMDAQADDIKMLQAKRYQLTKFLGLNQYAVNMDGEECVIALIDPANPDKMLGGVFTNIIGLTNLFIDAIQVAFVKGTKMPIIRF